MDKRYAPYIFATIMSVAMGFFMSFFLTWINTGLAGGFFIRWMKSFGIGVLVAFPISLIVAPVAQRIVYKLVGDQ